MRILYDPNAEPGAPPPAPSETPPPPPGGPDAGFSPSDFTPEPASQQTAPPSAGAPAAATPTQAQADWVGVRDFARTRGVDLSQYGDDEQALNYLMGVAQQQRQEAMYSQLGRQLAPHAERIQQYLQGQAQPQPQAQPDYMPPPLDDRWLSMVELDPGTGLAYGKPGTPPQIVDAVNRRITWQKDFNNNPVQVFDRHLQSNLPAVVDRAVEARMAALQQSQAVDAILQQNSSWLYARDPAGNMLRGPQGFVPTPQGQRYIQHVQYLSRQGITDPRAQDQLARSLTFGEIAMGQLQQPPAPPPAQARSAASAPNRNAAQYNRAAGATGQEGAVETVPEGLSLYEYMKRELDAAGITDRDFAFDGTP